MEKELPTIVERATNFQIISNESLEKAAQVSAWLRKRTKTVEERRKFFVDPLRAHVKSINEFFNRWLNPLADADQIITDKMLAWRRLENDRIAKENERLLKQAQKEAEKKHIPLEQAQAKIAPKIQEQVQTTDSGVFKKKWTYAVEDESRVPRPYLQPSDEKIKMAIKDGTREIPGLRIFEEEYFSRGR